MRVLVSVYTSWTCFLRFINTVFGVAGQKVCLFTDLEAADAALSRDPNKEISSTEEWTAAYLYSIYVIGLVSQFFLKNRVCGPKHVEGKNGNFYFENGAKYSVALNLAQEGT